LGGSRLVLVLLLGALVLLGGCESGGGDEGGGTRSDAAVDAEPAADAGPDGATAPTDGGARDGGEADDAARPADGGPPTDAGADGGAGADADRGDGGGASDVGGPEPDVGADDAGLPDVAAADAGGADAGPADSGPADAGPADAGPADVEPADLGPADAGVEPPACDDDDDCLGSLRCVEGRCQDPGPSVLAGALILNEVLIDGACDDANGDGDIDSLGDEFVELVNVSDGPLDLSGCLLVERDLPGVPRHTFEDGTVVGPGEGLVVFGGGSPSEELEAWAGATVVVAEPEDPAWSNGLNLNDAGDRLRLLDSEGREVLVFAYGRGCLPEDEEACLAPISDRSLVRSPEGVGPFVPHDEAPGADGRIFSPARRTDDQAFIAPR